MTQITEKEKLKLLSIALEYMKGKQNSSTLIELSDLTKSDNAVDLYQKIKLSALSDEQKSIISAILLSVNIETSEEPESGYQKAFADCENFYELLLKLYNETSLYLDEFENIDYQHYRASRIQIGFLIQTIKKSKPNFSMIFIFFMGSIISLFLGLTVYVIKLNYDVFNAWLLQTMPVVLSWLESTFSLLKNFAMISIMAQILKFTWTSYHVFNNDLLTPQGTWFKLGFAASMMMCNITANFLCFFAGGTLNIAAAIFFFLGSTVDIAETITNSWYALDLTPPEPDASWQEQAQYLRTKHLDQFNKRVLILSLICSILITAAVAIWCFVQPPFLISMACMAFSGSLHSLKEAISTLLHEQTKIAIQKSINEIDTPQEEALLPPSQDYYREALILREDNLHLRQEFADLQEKHDELTAAYEQITHDFYALSMSNNQLYTELTSPRTQEVNDPSSEKNTSAQTDSAPLSFYKINNGYQPPPLFFAAAESRKQKRGAELGSILRDNSFKIG